MAARADWAEAERRPHDEVMRALAKAGLLRLLAPAAYGGHELTLVEFLTLVEAASAVDGSAGWTLMTSNEELEIASAYLAPDTISALLASRDDLVVAGSAEQRGQPVPARPVPGKTNQPCAPNSRTFAKRQRSLRSPRSGTRINRGSTTISGSPTTKPSCTKKQFPRSKTS